MGSRVIRWCDLCTATLDIGPAFYWSFQSSQILPRIDESPSDRSLTVCEDCNDNLEIALVPSVQVRGLEPIISVEFPHRPPVSTSRPILESAPQSETISSEESSSVVVSTPHLEPKFTDSTLADTDDQSDDLPEDASTEVSEPQNTLQKRKPGRPRKNPAAPGWSDAGYVPATTVRPPASSPTVSGAAADAADFIYSKAITCPKCHALNARLRRRTDANRDADFWLHLKPDNSLPCMLRISHYTIKDDSGYRPKPMMLEAAAG